MDTLRAIAAIAAANRNKPLMVFDWNKAAREIVARNATQAGAGLANDWEWTGGRILEDEKPVAANDTYVFLASTWATPELEVDGETIDCYVMESEVPPDWGNDYAHIYWPQSALDILAGGR